MREIKFIAFVKKEKKIYFVDRLVWRNRKIHGVHVPYVGYRREHKGRIVENLYFHIKDIELMEFTGLVDKNGKEIYEGDIWNGKEVKFGQFYSYLENGLGDGYYITGFYITNGDGIDEPVESGGEVTGNIWENPELLKE